MKCIISYLLLLFAFTGYGQISIVSQADAKIAPPPPPKPDSSYSSLMGDSIFFLPASTKYKATFDDDYSTNFITEVPTQFQNSPGTYLPPYTQVNTYKPVYFDAPPNYRTPLKALQKRYFTITGFTPDDNYLKLKAVDNSSDSLLYFINKWKGEIPGFVIVKDYEEKKKEYLNHYFYLNSHNDLTVKDVITGNAVLVTDVNEPWKCYDVTYLETSCYYYPILALLLSNDRGNHIAMQPYYPAVKSYDSDHCTGNEFTYILYFTDELYVKGKGRIYDAEMIKRFGETYGQSIIEKRVKIGMTKEMCQYAWGKPTDIRTIRTANGNTEKWIYRAYIDYSNRFSRQHPEDGMNILYFKNGILTSIEQ